MDLVCGSGDRVPLREAAAYLRAQRASSGSSVKSLLNGASLSATPVAAAVASKEKQTYLAKRRQYLQRRQEEKSYNQMLGKLERPKADSDMQREMKSVSQHLSIGANMIAGMATAFFVAYYVARSVTDNETSRLLLGLAATIAMMVVEMVLYITRSTKQEELARRQRKSEGRK
ncbi:hypothetical protein SDRG_12064 [Saprolegnia diclina VS20]|uniref:Uncharacterized protein n=1 Tax=Saprolegnia diclina (strain VS20) TaxID=1156394 RepID=T0RD88_SAPDV|nr:hypothetical protein SDRG_12064 [Saprolegnia diclina VS20]EQC30213.1 hypothetical protein SDRG_12064 [Saprolegnia diclina VS20]|eukprot:XP_008616345.1 hypothetical protein SDRG_12064 [Saprolegnia diclina VS20]